MVIKKIPLLPQDAHEFLRLLIDSMQKCCRGPKAPAPTAFVGTASGSGLLRPGWGGPYHGHSEPKAYPFSVFAGALQSSVTCLSCNAVSRMVDPSRTPCLSAVPVSLYRSLTPFFKRP